MSDKSLMRIKDFFLLLIALGSIIGFGYSIYNKPIELETRLSIAENVLQVRAPIIESNTTKIKVLESQYGYIADRLDRIEKKLDRMNQ